MNQPNDKSDILLEMMENNCRLLNDALILELQQIHNQKTVSVPKRCIELIDKVTQYTELYLKFNREI
ncbi:hypothetical protein [Lysinibacillus piscis]|uniref:Spo0E family sporulation regulatory protein-aspartic acid phosphatase n=1 Tax=Lysinibacillus piscis TaxID=2518931 RepID=A0ABQ5NK34_9BACI|nr:hypothetical protein [Lysinibacillus sp. KH24]GLC88658.1 hypothetical protein LYSBPC_17850 [Lysinibacillus sp. KH24]